MFNLESLFLDSVTGVTFLLLLVVVESLGCSIEQVVGKDVEFLFTEGRCQATSQLAFSVIIFLARGAGGAPEQAEVRVAILIAKKAS